MLARPNQILASGNLYDGQYLKLTHVLLSQNSHITNIRIYFLSLSLNSIWYSQYFFNFSKDNNLAATNGDDNANRRFLQCLGSVTVAHLKKFIMAKYSLDQNFLIDVIYKDELLAEEQTLVDIAYAFDWKKV